MLLNLTGKFQAFKGTETPQLTTMRGITLFSQVATNELRAIKGLLHRRTYIKDEIIFDEGEKGQAIYFIIDGKVLICKQGRPQDGAIAELGAGQCFGEMALIDNSPRMAQVRAAEDCTLDVLFREDFLGLIETHSRIASKLSLELARMMGERLRQTINSYVL
ncbi:MAG: cyclic nucleotide-binding domain-containing protein [Gallionella sp.]|jgi:CRP-like cAMP-binding protein|nr:cyclic nucleotide-binding domain-containing protein [Gallionella sp.]